MDYDDQLISRVYNTHTATNIPLLLIGNLADDPGVLGISLVLNGQTVGRYQALTSWVDRAAIARSAVALFPINKKGGVDPRNGTEITRRGQVLEPYDHRFLPESKEESVTSWYEELEEGEDTVYSISDDKE